MNDSPVDNDNLGVLVFMGLSGVGKTTLSRLLSQDRWFHYSVDYRIWTRYLDDDLNDYLKSLAMQNPVLKSLLSRDAITVEHRVHFNNLLATSAYMGMLGAPAKGGSDLDTFNDRMAKHAKAEINAMLDIPKFQKRAIDLYSYPNLLVDCSGSLCEVVEPILSDPVLNLIDKIGTVVYIRASEEHRDELIRRAAIDPKPIYYRPDFLAEEVPDVLTKLKIKEITDADPAEIGQLLYPKLLKHRTARYESISKLTGVTLEMDEVFDIKNEEELRAAIRSKTISK